MRFPEDVPILSDGVVTLRAHRGTDLTLLHEMSLDADSLRWTAMPPDSTLEDSRYFATEIMRIAWEEKKHRGWAIEATDDDGIDRYAGNIDIRDSPIADVGYVLHPWARGRGIARRALQLATNWAFLEGGVEIIHWRAHVGNTRSLRVAWAAGFTLHGTIPGFLHERGRVLDAWAGALRFGDPPGPRTRWHESHVIEGDSIRLRPLRAEDTHRIVESCTDETSRLWLGSLPNPYTEATARAYVDACTWNAAIGNTATWAVADKESDILQAQVQIFGLTGNDPTSGEVGYWAHPDARGRGMTSEAVGLMVRHAFAHMGVRRLSLMAATSNVASNRVASKCGFVRIGTETAAELLGDGTFADMNVYELLA